MPLNDIREIIRNETFNDAPEFRILFVVFVDAFQELQNDEPGKWAKKWIFEPNIYFDLLCFKMKYDPESFRKRIRKALKKQGRASPESARKEIECGEGKDKVQG